MAELQQGRRVRRRLTAQVDADESASGLAAVYPVLNAFVRQTKTLLGHVHAQHARQSDRCPSGAFDLRIKRPKGFMQLTLRRDTIDLGREAVASRQLLLSGVFKAGKALLYS